MSDEPDIDRLNDATVRIDCMLYLPAINVGGSLPELFREEFCECLPDDKSDILYLALPMLRQFADMDERDADWIAEELMEVPGFLFQAATPVKQFHPDGVETYSWGYFHTKWLYAVNENQVANTAVAWALAVQASDKVNQERRP